MPCWHQDDSKADKNLQNWNRNCKRQEPNGIKPSARQSRWSGQGNSPSGNVNSNPSPTESKAAPWHFRFSGCWWMSKAVSTWRSRR